VSGNERDPVASKEVDAWFKKYENPHKDLMQSIRKSILGASSKIEECIKWSSPTFTYKGNMASFNPRSKKHASLMFHTGAKIPGKFPSLSGQGATARFMSFEGPEDFKEKKKELLAVVKGWIKLMDAG
jgi:hypothetical protein